MALSESNQLNAPEPGQITGAREFLSLKNKVYPLRAPHRPLRGYSNIPGAGAGFLAVLGDLVWDSKAAPSPGGQGDGSGSAGKGAPVPALGFPCPSPWSVPDTSTPQTVPAAPQGQPGLPNPDQEFQI